MPLAARLFPAVIDDDIILWCGDATAGLARNLEAGRETKATIKEGDRVSAIIALIVATQAFTLLGIQAKAALHLIIDDCELAMGIAHDILAFSC